MLKGEIYLMEAKAKEIEAVSKKILATSSLLRYAMLPAEFTVCSVVLVDIAAS